MTSLALRRSPDGGRHFAFAIARSISASWWLILAMALVVLGAKLILIERYGTITPYWDQWDSEAAFLYKPYLEGTFSMGDLLAAHNEHRILLTRLIGLGLLEATGGWFTIIQTTVNAVLHVVILAVLVHVLTREAAPRARLVFIAIAALFLAFPYGWENTLGAFQSQFYLVFGLSMLAVIVGMPARAFDGRWLVAFACALLAFFCMASGALTFAALGATSAFQIAVRARARSAREIGAVIALFAAAFALIEATPHVAGHDVLRAHSFEQFMRAGLGAAAWPLTDGVRVDGFWPLLLLLALIANAPLLALGTIAIARTPRRVDLAWVLLGLGVWVAGQWVAFAYGRGSVPLGARYIDSLSVGPLVNGGALLYLMGRFQRTAAGDGVSSTVRMAALAWVVALVVGFGTDDAELSVEAAAQRGAIYAVQASHVRAYLSDGDPAHIEGKPHHHIPYPDPERLMSLLNDPTLRGILPEALTGMPTVMEAHPVRRAVRGLLNALRQGGPVLLALGVLGFILAAAFPYLARGGRRV